MRNIPGTSISISLYFVGDKAFSLKPNLMRPFPRQELDFAKTIFNSQLFSARRKIVSQFSEIITLFLGT